MKKKRKGDKYIPAARKININYFFSFFKHCSQRKHEEGRARQTDKVRSKNMARTVAGGCGRAMR